QPAAERHIVRSRVVAIHGPQPERAARRTQSIPIAENRIAGKGPTEMQRRGQRLPAQPRDPRPRDDRYVEPLLQVSQPGRAEPVEQRTVRRTAAEEDVLAVVDVQVAAAER